MWGPKSSFSHRFFGRGGKRSLATTEAEEDVLPSHGSLSRSLQAYSGPPYNFGSSNLRFGTSTSLDSLDTSTGNLKQPFYYNGATWRKLTYSSNALDFVMKTGGTPHGPGTGTSGTGGTEVSFGSATVDVTGMDPSGDGHGLLIVSQTATVGSATVTLTREYTIANADSRTATMNVRVRAEGASVPSVLMWMGTRDDYIGSTDSPGKDIGDFDSDGNFVVGEGGKTVKVTSGSEAVFFTTPSENAYAVQARCCSFNNVVNMNPFNVVPGTSASNTELRLSIPGADGSYGVYFNLGDVADGGEVVATAAYAAGSIEDLAAVTEEVAAAANPPPTTAAPTPSPTPNPTALGVDRRSRSSNGGGRGGGGPPADDGGADALAHPEPDGPADTFAHLRADVHADAGADAGALQVLHVRCRKAGFW